jgi:hypothetical protein
MTTTSGEDRVGDMEEEDNCVVGQQGEVGVVEAGVGLEMSSTHPSTP